MMLSESLAARATRIWGVVGGSTARAARATHVDAMAARKANLDALKGMRRYKRLGPRKSMTFKGVNVQTGRVKVVRQKGKASSIASRKGWAKRHKAKTKATGAISQKATRDMLKARAGIGAAAVGLGVGGHQGVKAHKERKWRKKYNSMQLAQHRAQELRSRPSTIPMRDRY